MNIVLWVAQIILAAACLHSGYSKILVFGRHKTAERVPSGAGCVGMADELAAAIALLEIAGAMVLLVPVDLWAPNILLLLAAADVALLAIICSIYRARLQEHTTPNLVMFLLALLVIVGRWPR
ncbi:MAG: DoxX family protein [Terracidiphilus sp.]|jgi:hypothetical protein